jgi:hypothetical protein
MVPSAVQDFRDPGRARPEGLELELGLEELQVF